MVDLELVRRTAHVLLDMVTAEARSPDDDSPGFDVAEDSFVAVGAVSYDEETGTFDFTPLTRAAYMLVSSLVLWRARDLGVDKAEYLYSLREFVDEMTRDDEGPAASS